MILTKHERRYIKMNSGLETVVRDFSGLYQLIRAETGLHLVYTGRLKNDFAIEPTQKSVLHDNVGARWEFN